MDKSQDVKSQMNIVCRQLLCIIFNSMFVLLISCFYTHMFLHMLFILLSCAHWFRVYTHPALLHLIAPAKQLVGCRAPGMSALSLQPSRLYFSTLQWQGPLHLSPRFCGETLWLASPWLREARDPEACGAHSNWSRAAEMEGAVPFRGVSPWGVQARSRGNKHCMWVTVVCFTWQACVEIKHMHYRCQCICVCVCCDGLKTNSCKQQHRCSRTGS